MKKLLLSLSLTLLPFPALAVPAYQYKTPCYLEHNQTYYEDECTVVETRENNGALRTRNIYSNRFSLTVKSWFDKTQGFMTWDSYNQYNYKWEYKVGSIGNERGYSYVMPGFLVENVSWD